MSLRLTIGTRGSKLALYQAVQVRTALRRIFPNIETRLIIYKTLGDRNQELNLLKSKETGVFCGELENALVKKEIDIAVHSVKDLPGNLTPGLILAAYLEREDPREVLVSHDNLKLAQLPVKARIGTSSIRRLIQLKAKRSDLEFLPIRGNVETRIEKVRRGDYEATILALAGLKRLGLETAAAECFHLAELIPAPGQGCIGVEIREDNQILREILNAINHPPTARAVRAERSFLQSMNGNCESATGAYAINTGAVLTITGLWATSVERIHIETITSPETIPEELGVSLANKIKLLATF